MGLQNSASTLGNGWAIPQNVKQIVTMCSSNSTPRELKTYARTKPCTLMFAAGVFLIAKIWKQYKTPMDEWLNKTCFIHQGKNKHGVPIVAQQK